MKEKISKYVLYIISAGIIVGIYFETGFFTSLFATTVYIAIHHDRKNFTRLIQVVSDMSKLIK